jgi:hypothetical protein
MGIDIATYSKMQSDFARMAEKSFEADQFRPARKALARKKTPATRIAKRLKRTEGLRVKRHSAWGCPSIPGPDKSSVQPIEREAPPIVRGFRVSPQSPVFGSATGHWATKKFD